MNNRVSIPRELVPIILEEGKRIYLDNDLSGAVEWILRAYFHHRGIDKAEESQSIVIAEKSNSYDSREKESILTDLAEIFTP